MISRSRALLTVERAVATRGPGTFWIGVDGCGAAGKTTFADDIVSRVPGAVVVRTDDFGGDSVPEWDWPRFAREVVAPLVAGRAARYRRRPWDAAPAGWARIEPGSVVVVEGVSSTRDALSLPWGLRIWVEASSQLRAARIAERDGAALATRWATQWTPSQERYVLREDPQRRADLVVDGSGTGSGTGRGASRNLGESIQ